jgi:two-component system, sensor histidine kinase PdtaS
MRLIFLFIIILGQTHLRAQSTTPSIKAHQNLSISGSNNNEWQWIQQQIDKYVAANLPDSVVQYLDKKAMFVLNSGDYDKAAQLALETADYAEKHQLYKEAVISYRAAKETFLLRGQTDKALMPLQKSLFLSYLTRDSCEMALSTIQIVPYFLRVNKFDSAFAYIQKAKFFLRNCSNREFLGLYYRQTAVYFSLVGDYEGAIDYCLTLQNSLDLEKDAVTTITNYETLGRNFFYLKNYTKALFYGQKALYLSVSQGFKIWRVESINLLSDVYLAQGDTLKGQKILLETLPLLRESANPLYLMPLLRRLVKVELELNNLAAAKKYLEEAEGLLPNLKEAHASIGFKIIQIEYFLKTKQLNKANQSLDALMPFTPTNKDFDVILRVLELKVRVFEASGQTSKAFSVFKNYHFVKDSLAAVNQTRLAYAIESRYQLMEKNQEIGQLNVEKILQEERIKTAKNRQLSLGLGLVVALALGGFAFYLYRNMQRQTQELTAKNAVISAAFAEKDLLLREIHHRVKNNLQVVSSLLRLQSRHVQDNQAQEALREGRNRVNSMALIHQFLYQDDDVTKIAADEYIKKLALTLYKSYQISDSRIKLTTQIAPIRLDVDTAIPLGLILNELITNVLKHAFPNNQEGGLEVFLLRGGNNSISLIVKDNGIGFTEETLKKSKESFGWSLIELFSEKLEGQLTITNGIGTTVELLFLEK